MRMSAWSILPVTQVLSISFRNAVSFASPLKLVLACCQTLSQYFLYEVWNVDEETKCMLINMFWLRARVFTLEFLLTAEVHCRVGQSVRRWHADYSTEYRQVLWSCIVISTLLLSCDADWLAPVTGGAATAVGRIQIAGWQQYFIITSHEHAHYENTNWQQCISDCVCQSQRGKGWLGLTL